MLIYNRYIPFRPYYAINIFGVVLARREYGPLSQVDLNHEYIHTLQQRELLWLPFYLLYLAEWLFWLLRLRSASKAYLRISFEREAYRHQRQLDYRHHRRHFAQWRTQ